MMGETSTKPKPFVLKPGQNTYTITITQTNESPTHTKWVVRINNRPLCTVERFGWFSLPWKIYRGNEYVGSYKLKSSCWGEVGRLIMNKVGIKED